MREASVKRHLGLCPHAYQQSFNIIYLQASALFLQKNHAWLKISAYKANNTCKYLWVVSSLKFSNDSVFECSRWVSLHAQVSTKCHADNGRPSPFLAGSPVSWHRERQHLCRGAAVIPSAGGQDHNLRGRAAAVSERWNPMSWHLLC